jgi:hypothetical protein
VNAPTLPDFGPDTDLTAAAGGALLGARVRLTGSARPGLFYVVEVKSRLGLPTEYTLDDLEGGLREEAARHEFEVIPGFRLAVVPG